MGFVVAGAIVAGMIVAGGSFDDETTSPGGLSRALLVRVVKRVAKFEGGGRFDAVNPNNERFKRPPGPGVSAFLIQWTQKSGNLGKVLLAMRERDPVAFDALAGGEANAQALLQVTQAGSLDPVAGYVLWDPWWVSKFVAMGRHPPFIEVQLEVAATGVHMRAAIDVARALGLMTERGLALAFDRCVQQGEYGIPSLARGMADDWEATGWPTYAERLAKFGAAAVGRSSYPDDTQRRVLAVLSDGGLSDLGVNTSAAVV